jgi:hypothetical protein
MRLTHFSFALTGLCAACSGGGGHPEGLGGGLSGAGGTAGVTSGGSGSGGAEGGTSGHGAGGSASGSPPKTCSENELRTAAPAGKEMFQFDPLDERFPFSGHWLGEFSDDPRYIGENALADIDRDGDLDFTSGQRQDVGGGMVWWEYCAPDHWVRHAVGTGHTSWAGGAAADFDGDGWIDLIAGNSWYRNPRAPLLANAWERFETGGPSPEEIVIGDVTGAGEPQALYVHRNFRPHYWSPGADATLTWIKGPELEHNQQQGGAFGDLDGDGDQDILVGYRWWYENENGDGSSWRTVTIFDGGFDDAPLTAIGDLDGDGDDDFAMVTHFGNRVAWAENTSGDGRVFVLHVLATDKEHLHTVAVADFDNDGDLEILAGQNVGPSFIFENTDGRATFSERKIAVDTRAHDARVGDVDCDGDLDIAGAPWGDQNEGGEQSRPPRDHVYLRNMLVERGGPPLFVRQPYEVRWAASCAY